MGPCLRLCAAAALSPSTEVGQVEWTFDWTAPAEGTGEITIYLGVVDGNGAGSPPTSTLTDPWNDDVAAGAIHLREL